MLVQQVYSALAPKHPLAGIARGPQGLVTERGSGSVSALMYCTIGNSRQSRPNRAEDIGVPTGPMKF